MDQYLADLHIHSRHSRATSKGLTPRNLAAWADIKGLTVVATGDFTHAGWLAELEESLVPDGTGLFRLKDPKGLAAEIPWLEGEPRPRARFILSAEISSIYKRGGKVRKVHNLVYAPNLEAARKLNEKLARIGNLESDGRPILGLDSRHLLEMVLETDPLMFLIPAHIWTPWFSMFGSKSGFDSVEECFGPLASEIFALETGLSSDPEMNWMLSALDRFKLVSNSDAHSGEKLGREANLFSGDPSYEAIYRALRGEGLGPKFLGTVEFFPEEGKYHLDGHRACGVVMEPLEAKARGNKCPVCGKPLTLGVLHRVLDLADREAPVRPENHPGFTSLIPLNEIASEVVGTGPQTKKVKSLLARLFAKFGSEMAILQRVPAEDLGKVDRGLAEAIMRMRRGQVLREPGFDGQFGRIRVFTPEERRDLQGSRTLTPMPAAKAKTKAGGGPGAKAVESVGETAPDPEPAAALSAPTAPSGLNEAQQVAVDAEGAHVLVLAGPGTGKTHTLIARIEALLAAGHAPESILALTFTRRAATELRERIAKDKPEGEPLPRADTLHAIAFEFWTESDGEPPVLMSEDAAKRLFAEVNPELRGVKLKNAWQALQLARETMHFDKGDITRADAPLGREPAAEPEHRHSFAAPAPPRQSDQSESGPSGDEAGRLDEYAERYALQKASWNLVDFTDLLEFWLEKIRVGSFKRAYAHILVDEVQDLTPLQLAVIRALADAGKTAETEGAHVFAIGDPRQSIYAFRGAAREAQADLARFWPDLKVIGLTKNYRSAQSILDLSAGLFGQGPVLRSMARSEGGKFGEIQLFKAPSAASEISWIGERIRRLLGGSSLTLAKDLGARTFSPGDIAVLVRFHALAAPIKRSLTRLGVPCSTPETESFWNEPRVKLILDAAGRLMGMAEIENGQAAICPDRALAKGPAGLSAYLGDVPPFDRLFWQSPEFRQLRRAFDEHGGWAGLVSHVNAQTELELVGRLAEKVRIMSLHAAKGLEFEAVFLPALEDGLVPFAGTDFLTGKAAGAEARQDEDEERRLFYVGLTRAKSRLFLSHAAKRELFGRLMMLKPSRFLEALRLEGVKKSSLVARTVSQEKQLNLI